MQFKFKIGKQNLIFGGSKLKSSPKTKRPIDTKSATHLVLKASRGVLRLPKTIRLTNEAVRGTAKKYDFPLYAYANNSNHLHILIRITNRYRWRGFIRELTGKIAMDIKDLIEIEEQFWLGRPFTRIIKGWGRNYARVKEYIELNVIEAMKGLSREQARAFQKLRTEFASSG